MLYLRTPSAEEIGPTSFLDRWGWESICRVLAEVRTLAVVVEGAETHQARMEAQFMAIRDHVKLKLKEVGFDPAAFSIFAYIDRAATHRHLQGITSTHPQPDDQVWQVLIHVEEPTKCVRPERPPTIAEKVKQ